MNGYHSIVTKYSVISETSAVCDANLEKFFLQSRVKSSRIFCRGKCFLFFFIGESCVDCFV